MLRLATPSLLHFYRLHVTLTRVILSILEYSSRCSHPAAAFTAFVRLKACSTAADGSRQSAEFGRPVENGQRVGDADIADDDDDGGNDECHDGVDIVERFHQAVMTRLLIAKKERNITLKF